MGREVRKVPADWQHPKDENGKYIPLLGGSYAKDAAEWDECRAKWQEGLMENYGEGERWVPRDPKYSTMRYSDYSSRRPCPDDYMPDWPVEQRTHLMMYEDTSEGTPISPAFKTPKELARWLADNGASAFGSDTATYEQWLATIDDGYSVSMVFDTRNGFRSGVAFAAEPR